MNRPLDYQAKLKEAAENNLARWISSHPEVTEEGKKSQLEYFMLNARMKCDMCKRWMVTTLPTPATPLLRADAPHASICIECDKERN